MNFLNFMNKLKYIIYILLAVFYNCAFHDTYYYNREGELKFIKDKKTYRIKRHLIDVWDLNHLDKENGERVFKKVDVVGWDISGLPQSEFKYSIDTAFYMQPQEVIVDLEKLCPPLRKIVINYENPLILSIPHYLTFDLFFRSTVLTIKCY